MTIIEQNKSTTSTKIPCNQDNGKSVAMALSKRFGIDEIQDCESLLKYTTDKFKMTLEEFCDTAISALSEKFIETKKSKNSVRGMRSNRQNGSTDPKIDSVCICTCPQGKILVTILNT